MAKGLLWISKWRRTGGEYSVRAQNKVEEDIIWINFCEEDILNNFEGFFCFIMADTGWKKVLRHRLHVSASLKCLKQKSN